MDLEENVEFQPFLRTGSSEDNTESPPSARPKKKRIKNAQHALMRVKALSATCAGGGLNTGGTEARSRLYTRFSGFFPGASIFLGVCCWRI